MHLSRGSAPDFIPVLHLVLKSGSPSSKPFVGLLGLVNQADGSLLSNRVTISKNGVASLYLDPFLSGDYLAIIEYGGDADHGLVITNAFNLVL